MICERGYCVPESCSAGSEGCRCYANATCDPLDGVPMTCDGNVCKRTEAPGDGELNGRCREDGTCRELDGEPLICRSGACELAGCPSGELGCPCELQGRCDAAGGETVVCNDGRCVPPDCSDGQLGCPCSGPQDCATDSECRSGVCRLGSAGVSVEGMAIRGCDLVLGLPELAGAVATFSPELMGEAVQRGPRLALSFITRDDEDLTGQVAVVERKPTWFGEGVSDWSAELTVESSACYDRAGVLLGPAEVSVR